MSERGLSLRLGAWKVRIVGTQWLWVQGLATGGVQRFGKIPGTSSEADLLTKLLHGKKIQELVQTMGYHHTRGRSQLALKAAFDRLSQVDSEVQGTRNTRTDGVVRHENRVHVAQNERSRASRTIEWSGKR